MATAKLILDKRRKDPKLINPEKQSDDNLYPFRIRIFKGDDHRDITLPYKFTINDWDEKEKRVSKNYPNSIRVNAAIQEKYSIVNNTLANYDRMIEPMDAEALKQFVISEIDKVLNERQITPEIKEIVDSSRPKELRDLYLEKYGKVIIQRARDKKKNGTAKWYDDGIAAIKKFNKGKDILLDDITVTFLENFEAHHLSIGNTLNGIGPYLRAIRSITNKAIKELLKNKRFDNYPWGGGYVVKGEDTSPRPVRINVIDDIRMLKYEKDCPEWNAQRYLLFMFNSRGMNFIDLAKFTKAKVIDAKYTTGKLISGRLEYKRSKTNVKVSLKLTPESINVLNDYDIFHKKMDEQVFPIGYEESKTGRETYSQKRKRINKTLTKLAYDAGHHGVQITTYTLRYAFGTELRRQGYGLDVVQEALGQKDSRSAQIYTEDYEESVLDRVTEMIVTNEVKDGVNKRKKIGDKRVAVR